MKRVPASLKGQHRAAYIIGRISMAWGQIEQRLYHDIIRFEQSKNRMMYPHEVDIESAFDDRLKQWRRLCKSLTNNLSSVDRVIGKIKKLAPIRHHVAHGYPLYFPGFPTSTNLPHGPYLDMIEHRETTQRIRRHIKLSKKEPGIRIWASDLYARYTLTELEKRWLEMEQLGEDLFAVSDGILPTPKPAKLPQQQPVGRISEA